MTAAAGLDGRSRPLSRRFAALFVVDCLAWGLGLLFAAVGRVDFEPTRVNFSHLSGVTAAAFGLQLVTGGATWLYLGRHPVGSFAEVRSLTGTVFIAMMGLAVIDFLTGNPRAVPISVPFLGGSAALVGMLGARYSTRMTVERRRRLSSDGAQPLLVFGAGAAGASIVAGLLRQPNRYVPVALIDDDPRKRHLRLHGVPVVGDRSGLAEAAARYRATTVLLAAPSADRSLVRDIYDRVDKLGLVLKILPPTSDLVDGKVGIDDIRAINLADFLGRRQIETNVQAMAEYLTGKRVLVTGAGGSIGSELCRQVHRFAPAELVMLDRDESGLHATQLSLHGSALLDDTETVLADIRDAHGLTQVFQERQPEIVFHAAALKHLPLLEQFPGESVLTNVLGTLNVLRAARCVGVEHLVNISTDKAADPTSVLGYSKRIAERLTAHEATSAAGTFTSVRFGNVLGSRGSALAAFKAQIAAGQAVTITHPDVTRYFMTVQEAVQLVIQAGALQARPGSALVLDMGEPVRIVDVAKRMMATARRVSPITYTGLRPGEKLQEVLFGHAETPRRMSHPAIFAVEVPPLVADVVLTIDAHGDRADVHRMLQFYGADEDLLAQRAPDVVDVNQTLHRSAVGGTAVDRGSP